MAKKTINKELTGAQDLYNFLFEACNIIRGPVSQDNFKDYITPLLYYKRISDVYDEETEEALISSGGDKEYAWLSLKPWGIALKFLFLHHENILFPNDRSCCFFKLVLAFRNP